MKALVRFSEWVDEINRRLGQVATLTILLACAFSAGNALVRKIFDDSSNAWLEIQWYLFAAAVMLGASHTLKMNEHVRVDLIYGGMRARLRLWVDLLGGLLFLLPAAGLLTYLSWHIFAEAWRIDEGSVNAGGLIRWPVKLMLPLGFFCLTLQGLSEVIKRIAALQGAAEVNTEYEKPVQ